ncbi:NCS2 family permease [Defluviicoccus vanus]|uniref:NCS2 family permease n=1 Tax=Defluviicoccus vanus TaxID=111831 RepID=UPI001CBA66E9|nr:NCS2 family permease [Defluviicoccus vanus]
MNHNQAKDGILNLNRPYIVFVNPQILATTGMEPGAVFVATCLAAAFGSLVMALAANYPIALAPGMGLNAYFAFTVVASQGYSWQQALGAVFCSGVLFVLLSLSRLRERILGAFPASLRRATSAGIGLFLAIIALMHAGIVVAHPATLIAAGDLTQAPAILALVGFSLLFVDFFDTAGTLIGVAHRGGLLDANGRRPRLRRALLADSSATVFGALIGTSNTTSYIESAAGVAAGGRTGLTAAVTAVLFLLTLFLAPLAAMVPSYATAGALMSIACLMARGLAELDWEDVTEYAPAIVTAITMPLTYSIATGIGLGFITYATIKLAAGRWRDVSLPVIAVALLFCLKFALG